MSIKVQKKKLENNVEYTHSQYSGCVEPVELLNRMTDNLVQGNKQDSTYILSDWSDVDEILFNAEDTTAVASITSMIDLQNKGIFIAIFCTGNSKIEEQALNFIRSNANQKIICSLFAEKEQALQWLQENSER